MPSGTLWAKYNLCATNENDSGLYVQFGVPKGYAKDSNNNFLPEVELQKILKSKYTKTNKFLYNDDDAVYKLTNGIMQTPSPDDFKELFKYTTHSKVFNKLILRSIENDKELIIPYNDMFANNGRFTGWMNYKQDNIYLLTNKLCSTHQVYTFAPLITNNKDCISSNWVRNAFAVRPIKYKK